MNPSNIKVGDRIRIEAFEAVVTVVGTYGRIVVDDGPAGQRSHIRAEHVVEVVRPPVKVGDVITGTVAKATQWKRGTILRQTTSDGRDLFRDSPRLYVLDGEGMWCRIDDAIDSSRRFDFDGLGGNFCTFVVDYAPGK